MLLGSRGSRMRCLLVWIVTTVAVGAVAQLALVPLRHGPRDLATLRETPVDVALTEVAALALLACALWLWLVTTLVIGSVVRGAAGASPPRGVPAGVRRLVLAACGVALVGGLAQPSYADGPRTHPAAPELRTALVGLPLPDRAVSVTGSARATAPDATPGAAPAAAVAHTRTVVVRPGDSLWSIAADDLPRGSPNSAIASRWRAIYAANRGVIGADPDVIVAGQQLRLPREDVS